MVVADWISAEICTVEVDHGPNEVPGTGLVIANGWVWPANRLLANSNVYVVSLSINSSGFSTPLIVNTFFPWDDEYTTST